MINLKLDEHQFGTAKAEIRNSWDDAAKGWIFPNLQGGLTFYRAQLPEDTSAPVLIFEDIEINPEFRRKGLGSAGMMATLRHFRNEGARVAFLRIGTQGEDWFTGKVWRQHMFEKLGWGVLVNHPSNKGDVPIMWHPLKGDLSYHRVEEVELEIIDDSPFCF
jgi:hypothetical protein